MQNTVPPISLEELYNREIKICVGSFPEKLTNFAVGGSKGIIYASPTAQKAMDNLDYSFLYLADDLCKRIKNGAAAVAGMAKMEMDGTLMHLMEIDTNTVTAAKAPRGCVSQKFPAWMDQLGLFDHEFGHLIVEGGIPPLTAEGKQYDINRAETAADGFKAVRHIQRFGDGTDFFTFAPAAAANLLIRYAKTDTYTAPIMSKIETLKDDIDLTAFTLPQTAELVGSLVDRYRLDQSVLDRICAAYAPVRDYEAKNPEDMDGVRKKIFTVLRDHKNDHDVYRTGKYLIACYLDNGLVDKADPFWQDAITFMTAHEKTSGVILNAAEPLDAARHKSVKPQKRLSL